jgi:hypothetical protein
MGQSDVELVELAAKAAGYTLTDGSRGHRTFRCKGGTEWNPLNDDGDSLRLAVKLGIQMSFEGRGDDDAVWADEIMEYTDGDKEGVTRRVIVRAAAIRVS